MRFKRPLNSPPAWAARRDDRAIPRLGVPALADLGGDHLLAGQRRIAAGFAARVALGLALFTGSLARGWWPGLAPAMWLTYGGALTAVHHLIHGSLGLPARWRRPLRSAFALVVAESGTALAATHRAHHGTGPQDPEGYIEHVPWARMPIEALRFRFRLLAWALRHAPAADRRRIRAEAAGGAALHLTALALLPVTWWPAAYLVAVTIASAAFAVMAGKGPQTNWGRPVASPLVRVRARWASPVLFAHDRHLEHHAYPEVPLPRLHRLDAGLGPVLEALPAGLVEVRIP
jgi:fatty acid desaturase